jgi:Nucleotidyltransferase domain
MDLTDPTRAITSTLDGPVLATLALAGRPLSVGEVAAGTVRGSELGVRKSLGRLVEQGIVVSTEIGSRRIYELNHEHVAAPIAKLLPNLRSELFKRMRRAISKWRPSPFYASVFGSAARGDGSVESDIDILLVHPPRAGEHSPRGKSGKATDVFLAAGEEAFSIPMTTRDFNRWSRGVDQLRDSVRRWSGNRLQTVEMSLFEWRAMQRTQEQLPKDIHRDGVVLFDRLVFGPSSQQRSE